MSLADLVELARRRGLARIVYFHTDHFEPWGRGVTPETTLAVERFAEATRRSPYGARQSLFYLTHNTFGLDPERTGGRAGAPGDAIVFSAPDTWGGTLRQDVVAVIRPLVADLGHEMHLHVHHERWTLNALATDSPVWHYVKENSSAEQDERRLAFFVRLALATIAEETGRPLDRWSFVHGNWALNASDDEICRVEGEIALLHQAGCQGDFTFPAGRRHCDPGIEGPFTCLPARGVKVYDSEASAPMPVGFGAGAFAPERFLVWNSPLKAQHSSLDWFAEANLALFRNPEALVANWLARAVSFGDTLFLKTHAHSLNHRYQLWSVEQPPIPHSHPDVVAVFDTLMRVCDAAGIAFRLHTVNEVIDTLQAIDAAGVADNAVITAALERPRAPSASGRENVAAVAPLAAAV